VRLAAGEGRSTPALEKDSPWASFAAIFAAMNWRSGLFQRMPHPGRFGNAG